MEALVARLVRAGAVELGADGDAQPVGRTCSVLRA